MQRLLCSRAIQARLAINTPGDRYEQEADRVAEQVMRMSEPEPVAGSKAAPAIQRLCPQCDDELHRQTVPEEEEEEEEEIVQAKESAGQTPEVTPGVEAQVQAIRGGGDPLPASARAFFEPRFGHDFSQVRVHADGRAAAAARAVNALAYTIGHDVVFGAGQYAPDAAVGRQLLAHELTHVVQQTPSSIREASMIQRAPDIMATAAATGTLTIMRAPEEPCPRLVSLTARVKDPTVSDSCKGECRLGLGCCTTPRGKCGSTKDSGSVITATVETAKGCAGELAFAQNVTATSRRRTLTGGKEECLTATSAHADGGRPYKGCTVSATSAGKHSITTDDCPNTRLEDTMTAASVTESFKTYLLWKATDAKARTPIANVTWGWTGSTKRNTGKERKGCTKDWTAASGSHTDGDGAASSDRPATEPDIKSVKWGPCK
jgi:hypothetical protein